MIVAIEGPSASGKTTWCRTHAPNNSVLEAPENIPAPDLFADPAQAARFWVNHAADQWAQALKLEREYGVAFCDGDPFHLYFAWALWKAGAMAEDLFAVESELYRAAFRDRQVGFADHVLWIEVSQEELRQRARADSTRRRKRHELYLSLTPWMKTWFQQREQLLPGSVNVMDPAREQRDLKPSQLVQRYDLVVLDELLGKLSLYPFGGSAAPEN